MGHFAATDPFTRTPIVEGDDVLMVCLYEHEHTYLLSDRPTLIDMSHYAHAYELLGLVYIRGKTWRPEGVLIKSGKYSGYGWLEDSGLSTHPAKEMREREKRYTFFIHIEVLEWLGIDVSPERDLNELLIDVLRMAENTRTQLFHHNLLGDQDGQWSREERDGHALLMQVMELAHRTHYRVD